MGIPARAWLTSVAMVAAFPGAAWTDPVTITRYERGAIATASSGVGMSNGEVRQNADIMAVSGSSVSGPNIGTSSSNLVNTISVSNHVFSGTGNVAVSAVSNNSPTAANALAWQTVGFSIAAPHRWDLLGHVTASDPGSQEARNFANWAVSLSKSGFPFPTYFVQYDQFDPRSFTATGFLDAGTYLFGFGSQVGAFVPPGRGTSAFWTNFGYSFTLSDSAPVPEPGTFVLLGSGVLGLLAARARAKKARAS